MPEGKWSQPSVTTIHFSGIVMGIFYRVRTSTYTFVVSMTKTPHVSGSYRKPVKY